MSDLVGNHIAGFPTRQLISRNLEMLIPNEIIMLRFKLMGGGGVGLDGLGIEHQTVVQEFLHSNPTGVGLCP